MAYLAGCLLVVVLYSDDSEVDAFAERHSVMWSEYRDRFGPAYGAGGSSTSAGGFGERNPNQAAREVAMGRGPPGVRSAVTSRNRSTLSREETDAAANRAGLGGSRSRGEFRTAAEAIAAGAIPGQKGSRLGQSGVITSRQTDLLSPAETNAAAARVGLGNNNAVVAPRSGIISRKTSVIPQENIRKDGPLENAPTLRLTPDGLLLTPNNNPRTSEGNRLGDNQGGGGQDNAGGDFDTPKPQAPAPPATPPAQPSPPQQPRQRAAPLARGPRIDPQESSLLTLSLADVTRKSLLGV